jgi:CubicO group peptidase (beta-lactamase class C family)
MNYTQLQRARDYALLGRGSGLITRAGKLVMSWGQPAKLYDLKSTTKSIGITALGLALKDDKLVLTDRVQKHHSSFGILPQSNKATGWLAAITVLQLATMTAGFDKPGGYGKLLFAPGTRWAYSDGGANWLAEVLTLAYRQDLYVRMYERVFKPLGIKPSDLTWRANAYRPHKIDGLERREFGSGIKANVDAMAKIGYLYLREGEWNGKRIISESFVAMARTNLRDTIGLPVVNDGKFRFSNASSHYGLFWWNNADGSVANVPTDAYWSYGLNESLIVVIPSLDIVAARAGSALPGRNRSPNYYNVIGPFLEAIVSSVQPGSD